MRLTTQPEQVEHWTATQAPLGSWYQQLQFSQRRLRRKPYLGIHPLVPTWRMIRSIAPMNCPNVSNDPYRFAFPIRASLSGSYYFRRPIKQWKPQALGYTLSSKVYKAVRAWAGGGPRTEEIHAPTRQQFNPLYNSNKDLEQRLDYRRR